MSGSSRSFPALGKTCLEEYPEVLRRWTGLCRGHARGRVPAAQGAAGTELGSNGERRPQPPWVSRVPEWATSDARPDPPPRPLDGDIETSDMPRAASL